MKRTPYPGKKRIIWARNILLDIDLHKTTEIGILKQLVQRNYEIFFISAHAKQRYNFRNSRIHVFSIPVGKNLSLFSRFIFTLLQLLSFPILMIKAKPSFVVVDPDSIYALLPAIPLFHLLGTKVVLDVRSTPTPVEVLSEKVGLVSQLRTSSFRTSVTIAKRKLDGITIITDLMKKSICNDFGIDPNWVGVWSSGVSTELFSYERSIDVARELRKQLDLADKFVICYHGAFSQSRGLTDAVKATLALGRQYPKIVLFLLGNGSIGTVDEIRKLIQNSDLGDRILLHKPVKYDQVPKYIAMCDVGIVPLPDLPQWRYQCPLKLLEYLAMQKPVILTDIACHRFVVGNSECGIYIPSTDPNEIAEAIAFAFGNRATLKKRGAKGREIIERSYTWQKIAENLETYLDGLQMS